MLCSDPKVSEKVVLEISAQFPARESDQVKRAVSENARSLAIIIAD